MQPRRRDVSNSHDALDGYRILETGPGIAVALAAKLLAELGADAVRVEAPKPDPIRRCPPFAGEPEHECSFLHLYLNTGKRSAVLDLQSSAGRASLEQLLAAADLVIDGHPPVEAEVLGLTPRAMARLNPRGVLVTATPFGRFGPYAGFAGDGIVTLALGGIVYQVGEPDREPLAPYGHQAEYALGIFAAIAGLGALYGREAIGIVQDADVAGVEACAALLENAVALHTMGGILRGRAGNGFFTGGPVIETYECIDGYLTITMVSEIQWQTVCTLIGHSEWLDDPELQDWPGRARRGEEIKQAIREWCRQHHKRELFELFQTHRQVTAPVLTLEEVLTDPQHEARRFFVAADHPYAGTLKYPRAPFHATTTPPAVERAPLHGEQTQEVLREWTEALPRPVSPPARRLSDRLRPVVPPGGRAAQRYPLDGIRVVDLTTAWAGPLCTQLLADLGAEVIKVEAATRPDIMRLSAVLGDVKTPVYETGAFFHTTNYNKLSLSLLIDNPDGAAVFRDLVAKSDILVENFTPRVMPNLGFAYEELRRIRSDLIVVAEPAFGRGGPYENYVGYGEPMEGAAGLATLTGYRGEAKPYRMGVAISDATAALNATVAALAALIHRRRTGEGQFIDLSHFEACGRLVGEELLACQRMGRQPEHRGNRDPIHAPQGCYPCEGKDEWLTISVRSEEQWARLAGLLGDEQLLADDSLGNAENRHAAHDRLDEAIAAWTRGRGKYDAMLACQKLCIPAAAVLKPPELVDDPHMIARGFIEEVEHVVAGWVRLPAPSFKLSATPAHIFGPAPLFGEHTDLILRELLGRSDQEIARLRAAGVAGRVPDVG